MKSVFARLNEYKKIASPTELSIINFILDNLELVVDDNIHELSEHTFSSAASIIRLCKKLGFEGYKDFRRVMIYELAMQTQNKAIEKQELSRHDNLMEIVEKITYKNIVCLENTKNLVDLETLEQCVRLIINCRNICLFGVGSSLLVAKDAYLKFLRLNKPCLISEDWHAQLLQARNMSREDTAIIITYSGQTTEMLECAREVQKCGAPIITITKFGTTPISEFSDYSLFVAANESTFRSGAMASRISQLNIIDILFTAFANNNYEHSVEQISRTHIYKPK